MSARPTAILALVMTVACGPARAAEEPQPLSETQRGIAEQLVDQIPVEVAKTTPELREEFRRQGRPVMTVRARPGYVYRSYRGAEQRDDPVTKLSNIGRDVYGCVTVSYEIRPDGKTDGFEIVKSDPAGLFDKLAVRTVFADEFEPQPELTPRPRYQRTLWFLIARPLAGEASMHNERREAELNKRREALRLACEGQAP